MTSQLYQEWLRNWDQELGAKQRQVLLFQDNFSGHIVPEGLQNICVVNFSPNLTAHVQPLDQGIIQCFKAHYRAKYIQHAIDRYDRGVTPSEIYAINQLKAMRLANAAWNEVDATTIQHCWHKAGILPSMDSPSINPTIPIAFLLDTNSTSHHQENDPLSRAESEVESALDDLISTGALQQCNRMDIEQLLNPVDESQVIEETFDEDICKAMLDAQKAEDTVASGGDDSDAVDEACPTYPEVLQAVAVINKYVGGLDSVFARDVEAKMAVLGFRIRREKARNLTSTHITNYFSRS